MSAALRIVTPRLSTADNSFRRCLLTAVVIWLVAIPVAAAEQTAEDLPLLIVVLIAFGLSIFLIARLLRMSFGKAFIAWSVTLIATVPVVALIALVVRPYVFEAFAATTNSMAPTILGDHWTGVCPECGAPTYSSPEPPGLSSPDDGVLMICSRELRARKVLGPSQETGSGDRFFVNKLLKPARWDLVVYRSPTEPGTTYVKRLVGLPGEQLVIQDGAVWINGQKQAPPERYSGLYYENTLDGPFPRGTVVWGAPENPVELGSEEFYVLGDFSARSLDSRLWEEGAPGHPPYALPASNLVGVVTHIYWPLNRSRVIR